MLCVLSEVDARALSVWQTDKCTEVNFKVPFLLLSSCIEAKPGRLHGRPSLKALCQCRPGGQAACFTVYALTTVGGIFTTQVPALPDSLALLPCKPNSRKGLHFREKGTCKGAASPHLENTAACFTASSSAVSHWGRSMPNWLPTPPALPALPALLPCRNSRTAPGSLMLPPLPVGSLGLPRRLTCSGAGSDVAEPSPKKSACPFAGSPA